jgi:hypothetical protein
MILFVYRSYVGVSNNLTRMTIMINLTLMLMVVAAATAIALEQKWRKTRVALAPVRKVER